MTLKEIRFQGPINLFTYQYIYFNVLRVKLTRKCRQFTRYDCGTSQVPLWPIEEIISKATDL